MYILANIIMLIASSKISDQINVTLGYIPYEVLPYPMKPYEERLLPADLMEQMINKTDEDLAYEDCMDSYTLCRSSQKAEPDYDPRICSIDKTTSIKGSFESVCEMIYENCKHENGNWGYFHDGPCAVEFVEGDTAAGNETETQTGNQTEAQTNTMFV